MKSPIIISTFFWITFSFAQSGNTPVYLNASNEQISNEEFNKIKQLGIVVYNDSLNLIKVIPRGDRSEAGKVPNIKDLYDKLTSRNIKVDYLNPVIVVFHPGPDKCNTSGSASKSDRKKWFSELESKTWNIARTKPIYIYKKKDGTEKYDFLTWFKDPDAMIEKTFFDFHYPCSSFVIFDSTGNYISYFGEFSKQVVWEKLEEIKKLN